ncbi:hypothetical protein MNBD_GAMMA21-1951 [hydrothermal vent metagenome]|uniref:Universal stress protein UspA n=1 Tax=hydrothermal vent metagenome TaxID=652676 RepID=A0A3B1ACY8_9ZZZZ
MMNIQIQATQTQSGDDAQEPLQLYKSMLVALDSSDHANTGMDITIGLAGLTEGAQITGVHAYAAKLHDVRFRQMEGGLPEQFREEQELERQRDVHDDLITRGLSIITDSYLEQADNNCQQAGIDFARRSLEGKNYHALTRETNSGNYDLLVMGSLGLGAVEGSRLGTVCQRVTRRSDIDTLVIKQPKRALSDGPIVVAIDGSAMAYGGLITAMQLAQQWQVPLKVVAVFDPYFHYVAFNRIADVLSEEAGKVFRFKEQEQLHEDIIDSGLAKIYQGHLDVAQSIADEHNVTIETRLLDGKPHDAITKYIYSINSTLLVIGKLGIHADEDLDIGGNAENLLHDVDCAVLLSQREHQPRLDVVADVTTSWTVEAEKAMDNVPGFVRNMARMAILRHAQERGHTVITEKIVEEATATLCPSHVKQAMTEMVAVHDAEELKAEQQSKGFEKLPWSDDAEALLKQTEDSSVRNNLRKRAEKKARTEGSAQVETKHLESFVAGNLGSESTNLRKDVTDHLSTNSVIDSDPNFPMHWQTAALARLMRVPEGFMRDTCKQQVEDYAKEQDATEISLEVAEAGLKKSREIMEASMNSGIMPAGMPTNTPPGKCPFATSDEPTKLTQDIKGDSQASVVTDSALDFSWTVEAEQRMQKIPEGFMRDLTRQRVETFAKRNAVTTITPELIEQKYADWNEGSQHHHMQMSWTDDAVARTQKIPDFVRGMVIKEVERCATKMDSKQVTVEVLEKAIGSWAGMGAFHSEKNPDLYLNENEES